MLYTAPAIVMVLSYFLFKEHLTKLKVIALVMTLVGCIFVTVQSVCLSNVSMISFTVVFGLLSTVLPYALYTYALNSIENGKAAIIATIEPVVATMIGIVIYKEVITLSEILEIIFIIGAIVLCNIKQE